MHDLLTQEYRLSQQYHGEDDQYHSQYCLHEQQRNGIAWPRSISYHRVSSIKLPPARSSNVRPASSRSYWKTRSTLRHDTCRRLGRQRRRRADSHHGQWRCRHQRRGPAAGRDEPRHQQAQQHRRSVPDWHARLPRRGMASIAEISRLTLQAALRRRHADRGLRRSAPPRSNRVAARSARQSRSRICSSTRPSAENFSARRRPRWDTSPRPSRALAYPDIHSPCTATTAKYDLPPADPWSDRIERLFGDGLSNQLIWVESRDEQIRLWGYVAHPGESRSNQRPQYLFLNGRYIRDRSLQHALSEAYRGLL